MAMCWSLFRALDFDAALCSLILSQEMMAFLRPLPVQNVSRQGGRPATTQPSQLIFAKYSGGIPVL